MQEHKNNIGKTKDYGIKGIGVSALVAIAFMLICNLAVYLYIQAQGISTESQRTSMEAWLGIQKLDKPVDILLLGDSAGRVNIAPGAFSDRLGGSVINLANTAQTSMLTDAWMLSAYMSKFGAPRAVVVTRTSVGYAVNHNIEFMANPPLPWGYWDDYGIAPVWKEGEILRLFLTKYGVLYSDADVLRERLVKPWDLFNYAIEPRVPSHSYTTSITFEKEKMDVNTRTPAFYFDKFYACPDSVNAVRYMAEQARAHKFQLYFTLQCEWNQAVNAGLRAEYIGDEKKFLLKYCDPVYVHVVEQVPKTLFSKEQMQSPNHLWHGAEKIYTEEIVNGVVAIQNELSGAQARDLKLASVSFDKDSYKTGEKPVITVEVNSGGRNGTGESKGGVSCLAKLSGDTDGKWKARAPTAGVTYNDGMSKAALQMTAGGLDKAGTYDLVVFLRQDVGNLSYETRIEIPKAFTLR